LHQNPIRVAFVAIAIIVFVSGCSSTHKETSKTIHKLNQPQIQLKTSTTLKTSSKDSPKNSSSSLIGVPSNTTNSTGQIINIIDNPYQLLKASQENLIQNDWISYNQQISYSSVATNLKAQIFGTAGVSSGIQTILSSAGNIKIVQVNQSTLYIQGNSEGLSTYAGFNQNDANNYQNMWIQITNADNIFTSLASEVTLQNLINRIYPVGPFKIPSIIKINNQQAIQIQGYTQPDQPGQANSGILDILYLDFNNYLPISDKATSSTSNSSYSFNTSFFNYGQPIQIEIPTNFVSCGAILSCA